MSIARNIGRTAVGIALLGVLPFLYTISPIEVNKGEGQKSNNQTHYTNKLETLTSNSSSSATTSFTNLDSRVNKFLSELQNHNLLPPQVKAGNMELRKSFTDKSVSTQIYKLEKGTLQFQFNKNPEYLAHYELKNTGPNISNLSKGTSIDLEQIAKYDSYDDARKDAEFCLSLSGDNLFQNARAYTTAFVGDDSSNGYYTFEFGPKLAEGVSNVAIDGWDYFRIDIAVDGTNRYLKYYKNPNADEWKKAQSSRELKTEGNLNGKIIYRPQQQESKIPIDSLKIDRIK